MAPSTSFSSSAVAAQAWSVGAPGVLDTLGPRFPRFHIDPSTTDYIPNRTTPRA